MESRERGPCWSDPMASSRGVQNTRPEHQQQRLQACLHPSCAAHPRRQIQGVEIACLIKPKSVNPFATNCTANATNSSPMSRAMMRMPVLPK